MKWALVLSGGGALGLAHIGVVKVLERENLRPDMIVGCSMGAVVGALWATGRTGAEMEEIARNFKLSDHLEGLTHKIPFDSPLTKFLRAEEALGALLTGRGMTDGRKIRSYLQELYGGLPFEETAVPFFCNAVDLLKGHEMILRDGPLADGVYASMAYPGFFEPLERGEELLCDGSVLNNFPVWIARTFGRRRTVGVDVGRYPRMGSADLDNGPAVMFRSFQTACRTQKRGFQDRASLTIRPGNDGADNFAFHRADRLIRCGEEAAEKALKALKKTISSPLCIGRTINA